MTTDEPPYPLLDEIHDLIQLLTAEARRLQTDPAAAAETPESVLVVTEVLGRTLDTVHRLAVDVGRLRIELGNHGVQPPGQT